MLINGKKVPLKDTVSENYMFLFNFQDGLSNIATILQHIQLINICQLKRQSGNNKITTNLVNAKRRLESKLISVMNQSNRKDADWGEKQNLRGAFD